MARTYPVVEIFGPTIQGEGPAQGERCWFLRLGGCDYECTWCDSMRAVNPAEVRKAPRRDAWQIAANLTELGLAPNGLLIVSGGNPALHHLDPLLDVLPEGVRVHVETQGTVWRSWLNRCDLVVVSPKPPSAWNGSPGPAYEGLKAARKFLAELTAPWVLKVVAFNDADLDWAVDAHRHLAGPMYPPSYLSAGTEQEASDLAEAAVSCYRWLANEHVRRPELGVYRVGLQAHVLAWPGELNR